MPKEETVPMTRAVPKGGCSSRKKLTEKGKTKGNMENKEKEFKRNFVWTEQEDFFFSSS
jgi:hypothetical protein